MSDDLVKQALAELGDVVRCRCHPAYKDRGLHDPGCECDSAGAVAVVAARIEALERELAASMEALDSIAIYGADTLSGNTRGPDDRDWQREGVCEMTRRAQEALAAHRARTETNHE